MTTLGFAQLLALSICVAVLTQLAVSTDTSPKSGTCSSPNCLTCVNGGLPCTKCHPLYGLNAQNEYPACIACNTSLGCVECDRTDLCTRCASDQLGPDFNGQGTCSPCGPNCRQCHQAGSGKCDVCSDPSKKPANGSCTCTPNCLSCTTSYGVCDECAPNYGIGKGRKCIACPANCVSCYGGPCTVCQPGFTLVGAACVLAKTET